MKNKIVIVGGEMQNKGAQAMTFTVVTEMSRRFPDHEIVLVSHIDYKSNKKYRFEIIDFDTSCLVIKSKLALFCMKLLNKHNKQVYDTFQKAMEDVEFVIDVSGYALSSVWGIIGSCIYLYRIEYMRKSQIPMYLFPQSFGPFDYPVLVKGIMNKIIKKTLSYPEVIYAREREGFDILTNEFALQNVKLSADMVLLNKEIDSKLIFKEIPTEKDYEIKNNSIAILPNTRTFEHGSREKLIILYKRIIEEMSDKGYSVYLMSHSTEDLELCELLKKRCVENSHLFVIKDELNCIEFSKVVRKFKFLIASRYHSIVHAYKENVPCVIIGWARKYYELADLLSQTQYQFDARNELNQYDILKAIHKLADNYEEEAKLIREKLNLIQGTTNIFDIIEK